MKRCFKILSILIVTFLCMFIKQNNIYANEQNCFFVVNVSDKAYSTDIKIKNGYTNIDNTVSVGQKLDGLIIISIAKYNGQDSFYQSWKWSNPDYIIQSGEQEVTAILNDKITFTIKIVPSERQLDYMSSSGDEFWLTEGKSWSEIVPPYHFYTTTDKNIKGTMTYTNTDDLSIGSHDIGWTFTPDDTKYMIKSGVYKVNITAKPNYEDTNENTATTLTASKLMLSSKSSYDININNKPSDAENYTWSSSDTSVAKVNSKGIVTSVGKGNAIITCEITDSKGNKTDLKSNVIVGQDDNFPTLSDDDITIDTGDTYKLKVDNKTSGSTVNFKSSNKAIVKVSTSGKITGIKSGACTIIVTITTPDDNVTVLKCNVEVTD